MLSAHTCIGNVVTRLATDGVPHTIDGTRYLRVLRSALMEVRSEWRDLGIELGITVGNCDVSSVYL